MVSVHHQGRHHLPQLVRAEEIVLDATPVMSLCVVFRVLDGISLKIFIVWCHAISACALNK